MASFMNIGLVVLFRHPELVSGSHEMMGFCIKFSMTPVPVIGVEATKFCQLELNNPSWQVLTLFNYV